MELSESSKQKIREIIEKLLKMNTREIMSYWINAEIKEAEMYYRLYEVSKEITWDERISQVSSSFITRV